MAGACGFVAFLAYRRPLIPLPSWQRATLTILRGAGLLAVVLLLCRPVRLVPPRAGDAVIPVLLDSSRSMRVSDSGGAPRLTQAIDALQRELLPALSARFRPEIYTFGDTLTAATAESIAQLDPSARQTGLTAAISAVRDRFRGRPIAGVVVISDGGDTSQAAAGGGGPAIFTVGVGSAAGLKDRELVGVTAGDPRIDRAAVDLFVTAVSHGYGREPIALTLRSNGQTVETRQLTPAGEGSPVSDVFTVASDPATPIVYTLEIAQAADEISVENNVRSVLVSPAGRKRRILALQGAPGFEHSFLTRALSRDSGLELDTVVRKGRGEGGQDTFFVQASSDRSPALTQGFPSAREALYKYDAVIVANLEADFFKQAQLGLLAEFAATRGGGLLVLGGRSFTQRGLVGTPLEDALPVELSDRRSPMSSAAIGNLTVRPNVLTLTPEGAQHPITRIGAGPDDSRQRWAALPALAAITPLGGPRPGAAVLLATAGSGGIAPVAAVQRFGAGRSMIFAGEASWRWRMLLPATDRTYDQFWRQAVRWLSTSAPDPVNLTLPDAPEPGDSVAVVLDVRNAAFEPVPDATVRATLTRPGGASEELTLKRDPGVSGRFAGGWQPSESGLYRVQAEAMRGQSSLGTADRYVYVGGTDREFADPRLNEGVLRRIARDTGGAYVPLSEIADVVSALESAVPARGEPERRDLWHEPWAYAAVLAILSAEWILRRRWGLR